MSHTLAHPGGSIFDAKPGSVFGAKQHSKTTLKALWGHDTGGGAKRVERLRVWCADAERSGIQRLEDFATVLRAYTLQSA
jgi:hypothetical protein